MPSLALVSCCFALHLVIASTLCSQVVTWVGGLSQCASYSDSRGWRDYQRRAQDSVVAEQLGVDHGRLIVKPDWLRTNAPCLLESSEPQFSCCGEFFRYDGHVGSPIPDQAEQRRLQRCVLATAFPMPDTPAVSICYSLPSSPEQLIAKHQRRDRHRRREEAALRQLESKILESGRESTSGSDSEHEDSNESVCAED